MDFESKINIVEGMWLKCKQCNKIIYNKDLEENYYVCPECNYHMRLPAKVRLKQILDKNTFEEMYSEITTENLLMFEGYEEKIEKSKIESEVDEAVIVGCGNINNIKVAIGVMDSHFMMGSMARTVGERITRLVQFATENNLTLILFTALGGARMQEGIISLMQMAKVSATIAKFKQWGGVYNSVNRTYDRRSDCKLCNGRRNNN